MANHPNRSKHPSPRFKAAYRGEVLGWYDTADEAGQAIERAREADRELDKPGAFETWYHRD